METMTKTKERPILFSGEMVKAILDGRKTQTRRIVKPQPVAQGTSSYGGTRGGYRWPATGISWNDDDADPYRQTHLATVCLKSYCPFGGRRERLWVKETFGHTVDSRGQCVIVYKADDTARYLLAEDEGEGDLCGVGDWVDRSRCEPCDIWKPSIHMPRWASRLTLEITNIRVERLQDGGDREFWGEQQWALNPWVWVIEFKRAEGAA